MSKTIRFSNKFVIMIDELFFEKFVHEISKVEVSKRIDKSYKKKYKKQTYSFMAFHRPTYDFVKKIVTRPSGKSRPIFTNDQHDAKVFKTRKSAEKALETIVKILNIPHRSSMIREMKYHDR